MLPRARLTRALVAVFYCSRSWSCAPVRAVLGRPRSRAECRQPCLTVRGTGSSVGRQGLPPAGRALAAERVWALGDDVAVEVGDDAGPDRDGDVHGGAVSFLLQRRDRAGASTGENCADDQRRREEVPRVGMS